MDYYPDMNRLARALLELSKAVISRPKKPAQASTKIHWTKADKPLGDMSTEERKNFAEKMATESLKSLESKPNTYIKTSFLKQSNLIIILLSLLICLLVFFNWSKVPKYGNNAKALTYVKLACINSNTVSLNTRNTAAEQAFSLDPTWERLANAYRDIFSTSEIVKMMAANGMEDSAEYRSQYSSLQSALVTANGICNGVNLK